MSDCAVSCGGSMAGCCVPVSWDLEAPWLGVRVPLPRTGAATARRDSDERSPSPAQPTRASADAPGAATRAGWLAHAVRLSFVLREPSGEHESSGLKE